MGAVVSLCSRKWTRQDEQACEAGGMSERRIDESVPDDAEDTLGSVIVRYNEGQLHCSNNENQSLLFSCNPRAAASGNVLDPSGSGENVQQLRSFEIDPAKHKIFLSHSGEQKNFVEQLCVDLEARGYLFPFFDQRYHSLPKGKDFAPLIKQAAGQCHVAVIVLSEKFLCSKWPMIELVEFHAARRGGNREMSMLPLFYKLKVEDLDDESIKGRWMPVWNELASRDKRIDVSIWVAAIKALRGANGLQFHQNTTSEVGYRREIVGSIWKRLRGDLQYDSVRHMVGFNRICKSVSKKFVKDNVVGASVLGLYGTSGLGKTTLAKAACDYFAREFEGRVCHIELGKNMERMKRQKLMLKTLCGVEEAVLSWVVDDRQGLTLMRARIKRDPVLLVIDNLTNDESSKDEAHEYLEVGFHPRSKVMIIARTKEVLQDLLPGVEFCMSIPKLNEEEAGMIFLRSAAPRKCFSLLTDEERRVLRLCVDKCLLESVGFRDLVHEESPDSSLSTVAPRFGAYHPLALKALGDYFYRLSSNTEMMHWKDSLEENNDLMRDVLQSPSIMGIIHLQFSTLSSGEQLLFLDLAFYLRDRNGIFPSTGYFLSLEHMNDWMEWLAVMHGERESIVKRQLRELRRSGMINFDGLVDEDEIYPHVSSLYGKFAEWYAIEHGVAWLKNAFGVFQPCGTSLRSDLGGSKCISNLVRLRVLGSPRAMGILASKKMRELGNLVLLQLFDCNSLQALNLVGLDSLVHLELVRLPNLVTVTFTESSGTPEDIGIFKSLLYIWLDCLDSLTHVPDLRSCTSVLRLCFTRCLKVPNYEGVECPNVRGLEYCGYMHQLERRPNFRSLQCLSYLCIHMNEHVDMSDAMDFAIKLKQTKQGQSVALGDCATSDEFSADSDGYVYEKTTIYRRREKLDAKEGLSILQDVLLYQFRQGWHHRPVSLGQQTRLWWKLRAKDQEGEKEVLLVFPCNGIPRSFVWLVKSPEDTSPEEYDD